MTNPINYRGDTTVHRLPWSLRCTGCDLRCGRGDVERAVLITREVGRHEYGLCYLSRTSGSLVGGDYDGGGRCRGSGEWTYSR